MTADGVGGPADDVAARALFEKAAAQSHPGALERMGAFAQSGRGGPQDAGAAKVYYEKAAALGNEDAKAALKRAECPYVLKDKRGNVVTTLCFERPDSEVRIIAAHSFSNFGIKETLAIYDLSAVFGFEVSKQTRGYNDRNFKSTALA